MLRCLAVITVIVSVGLAGRGAAAAEVVRLVTQDWPPYQMTANGKVDGIAVRVIACVLDRLGLASNITVYPWPQAQQRVKDGDADGFFSASRDSERDAYATLSVEVVPQSWRWYWRRDHPVDVGGRELAVGVQAGTTMQQWLIDNGYTRVQTAADVPALIALAESGRVEAVLASQLVFDWGLLVSGVSDAEFTSQQQRQGSLGVYFAKGFLDRHPAFLEHFNAEIADCRVTAHVPEAAGPAK